MDEINYDAMGKEALRREMRDRELSYSGMKNEDMRNALREDDKSHAEFGASEQDEFEATPEELAKQAGRPNNSTDEDESELRPDPITDASTGVTDIAPAPMGPRTTVPRATRAGLKIETNREERNGVKRPSAGGVCRAVWDTLDAIVATKTQPTAKMIREIAPSRGWNPNNAMIEFYQWRKFNGITGRAK